MIFLIKYRREVKTNKPSPQASREDWKMHQGEEYIWGTQFPSKINWVSGEKLFRFLETETPLASSHSNTFDLTELLDSSLYSLGEATATYPLGTDLCVCTMPVIWKLFF